MGRLEGRESWITSVRPPPSGAIRREFVHLECLWFYYTCMCKVYRGTPLIKTPFAIPISTWNQDTRTHFSVLMTCVSFHCILNRLLAAHTCIGAFPRLTVKLKCVWTALNMFQSSSPYWPQALGSPSYTTTTTTSRGEIETLKDARNGRNQNACTGKGRRCSWHA